MLSNWLTPERIKIIDQVTHWEEAIKLSAEPLLADGAISEAYIDAIIRSHHETGPYYVLAPGLAMPHARPEQGAYKTALSLLHIKQGVSFAADENDPVYMVIFLCALSGEEHLSLISQLAELFSNEEDLAALLNADNQSAIDALIAKY
ncbi:PTS system ascorbate-specific IIA component [Erwinia toletana]|uniref:PTS system ascorbate-specific IIA component n=1 Tax=Winslowiella toletana TaxID=92490 RepID=A0ABS4P3G0_9GAMM|nr:PTS sugar transporter subunit IIA [Winslowiella toletana]MBP2167198.1 PTS system ascorbate-specific IIA component [Winslowiella toletana]